MDETQEYEEVDEQELKEDFESIMSKVEDGQIFTLLVDGECRAILIDYKDFLNFTETLANGYEY